MKYNITMRSSLLLFLVFIVSLTACEPESNLDKKKNKLKSLKEKMASLKKEIKTLEEEIASKDSTFLSANRKSTLITTVPVVKDTFYHYLEVRGSVASRKDILISAETMGAVNKVYVKAGEKVKKGQTLILIDAETIQKNIAELKSQLELASTLFEKQEKLWKQGIGTEVQYLQAKNNKVALENSLATAYAQRNLAVIKAPFNGTVEQVMVREGESAQPGLPLIRVVSLKDLYIKADIPEVYVGQFNKDDKVNVYFPYLKKTISAPIAAVGQIINEANRTFSIEIELPSNPLYKPNLTAILKINNYQNDNALIVPTNLIQQRDNKEYLYTVEKHKDQHITKRVWVKTGKSYANETEVLEGLSGNEILVKEGFSEVTDGGHVVITKTP